jgi:rubrerythrin
MSAPRYRMMEYRGLELREDPAREKCFRIVHQHYQRYLPSADAPFDPTGREGLHTLMNSELVSLEIAAQSIADFPDAPWELKMMLARVAWDESRHAAMCLARLRAVGGFKGQFPIINHEFNVVCRFDSLAARLNVQNRTFEAGSLEGFPHWKEFWEKEGDPKTAAVIDTIMSDEISHARSGNHWVRRLVKQDPRSALAIGRAMAFLKRAVEVGTTQPGEVELEGVDHGATKQLFALREEERRAAGFSEAEIDELRRRDHIERGVRPGGEET